MAAVAEGGRDLARREARAQREAAADALGGRHDVGRDAGPFVREQLAGAAHAGLHLVEEQQQAELVAHRAQALEILDRGGAHAALALHRLHQDGGGLRPDLGAQLVQVLERHVVEAFDVGRVALQVFRVAGGGEAGQRAAVERAVAGDDAVAPGIAEIVVILAHQLEAALDRLDPGIAEEHLAAGLPREGRGHQPLRQLLLPRHAIEVGGVPDLGGLLVERRDQVRMAMPERRDRDPAREIEEAPPVDRDQPRPLAARERQLRARIGVHQRGRTRAARGNGVAGSDRSIHRKALLKSNSAGQWPAGNELGTQEMRGRLLGEVRGSVSRDGGSAETRLGRNATIS